jgi:hypothetical protein
LDEGQFKSDEDGITVGAGDVADVLALSGVDATEESVRLGFQAMRSFLPGLASKRLCFHVRSVLISALYCSHCY